MVSIIPGWVYSLFAALVVGTIVVSTCSLATVNVRNEAENQQLRNIDTYVATQSLMLLTHVADNNQSESEFLNFPSQIANQIYWVSLANDSSAAWVESGFGTEATTSQPQIYLPAQVAASGFFVSGYGRALLQCINQNQTVTLTLTSD